MALLILRDYKHNYLKAFMEWDCLYGLTILFFYCSLLCSFEIGKQDGFFYFVALTMMDLGTDLVITAIEQNNFARLRV